MTVNQFSHSDLKVEFVDLTPDDAARMLDANYDNNRNIRASQVDRYAAMMRNGEWPSCISMLIVDSDGRLIDGQHRLAAQVKSGKTIGYVILSGVPTESYRYIDSGVRRRTYDRASTNSVETSLAGAMLQYEAGAPIRKCLTSVSGGNAYVTEQEHIDYCDANHATLHELVSLYAMVRKNTTYLSVTSFGTFYSICREKQVPGYIDFIDELTKWNTTCPQAMAAIKSFTNRPNGKAKTNLEQLVILVRSAEQYGVGYIPRMPTKSVATEKQLDSWRKKVE